MRLTTVIVTSKKARLKSSSRASTVTRYSLFPSESSGFSKSGGLAKERAPVSLMVKSLPSAPEVDHSMLAPSESEALKV